MQISFKGHNKIGVDYRLINRRRAEAEFKNTPIDNWKRYCELVWILIVNIKPEVK